MRKIILATALFLSVPALALTQDACNSSIWTNPVAQIQAFEDGAIILLNTAQAAWVGIQPLLPAASAAAITQQYENAVVAVNDAINILNDAVTAAMAAQQTNPNFAVMMSAVTDAIQQVLAIIDQYQTNGDAGAIVSADGGTAAPTTAIAKAHVQLTKLKQMTVR